jgi:hypothetical protein
MGLAMLLPRISFLHACRMLVLRRRCAVPGPCGGFRVRPMLCSSAGKTAIVNHIIYWNSMVCAAYPSMRSTTIWKIAASK